MPHALSGDGLGSYRRAPFAGAVNPARRAAAAGDGRAGQVAGRRAPPRRYPGPALSGQLTPCQCSTVLEACLSPGTVQPSCVKHLLTGIAPFGTAEARRVLEAELGRPLDAVFSEFGERPVAAASLAQVDRARRVTGAQGPRVLVCQHCSAKCLRGRSMRAPGGADTTRPLPGVSRMLGWAEPLRHLNVSPSGATRPPSQPLRMRRAAASAARAGVPGAGAGDGPGGGG